MRKLWALSILMAATPVAAQDEEPGFFGRLFGGGEVSEEESGSFLENMIEENLSGEGRDVTIRGFRGVLSGSATMESMTISDVDGTWLTLTGVTLDWSRAALLRGRLSVAELTAASIELPRLPAPGPAQPPSPEASGFSLPELPVSIEIGRIAADRVEIGEPVFGAETIASIDGGISLAGGEGAAALAIERLNGDGTVALDVSYANETQVLALDLSLEEAAGGIVATLMNLPGTPSLALSVSGEAPVTEYAADLLLATDGQDRLIGRIETETPEAADGASLRLLADIEGDIAPVFLPDYQEFFGDNVVLSTRVTTFEDGRISLDDLTVGAAALNLNGAADIGADGLPDRLAFEGDISDPGGDPVLLPLSGPATRVDQVVLDVTFDAEAGDRWTGLFQIDGMNRPGFSAENLILEGTGQISGGAGDAAVSANLEISATALDLGSETAGQALGERVTGGADITWATGDPIRLTGLNVNGETYDLAGFATVATGGPDGVDANGQLTVSASDLSVFSGIAMRELGGSAALETKFDVQPLAGFFDISVEGSTTDLVVSQPEADRILAGRATLVAAATRDETGLEATLTTLESPNASIVGEATLRTGSSALSVSANLVDAALVLPELAGPVSLSASADQTGEVWTWEANGGLEGATLDASGDASDLFGTPRVSGEGSLTAADLSVFSGLAGREIAGAVETRFSGEAVADLSEARVTIDGRTTDIVTGIAEADRLLTGPVRISLTGGLMGETLALDSARIDGRNVQLTADASFAPETGAATVSGRISSASLLLEGAPEGPLDFSADTTLDGTDWSFDVDLNGPNVTLATEGIATNPTSPDGAVEARLTAQSADLSVFSGLANTSLAGQLSLEAEGGVSFDLEMIDIDATANGRGLSIGQQQVDQLLAGDLRLVLDAAREGDAIEVATATLTTNLLDVASSGSLGARASSIDLNARLADIAPFVSGFSGPLTVTGTVGQNGTGADYVPAIEVVGPGGANATISGSTSADFANLNLGIVGDAPLGLINQFIQPRSLAGTVDFDVSVNGPPSVNSVSGTISTSGTRLVAPAIRINVNDIGGSVQLQSGQANIAITAAPEAGGLISIDGPLGLAPPFQSQIDINLDGVTLVDPRLFEIIIDGDVGLDGALQGGASIFGDIELVETNIRIPSSAIGGGGAIPEVVHINEPPPVRATRQRAGLVRETTNENAGPPPSFPLDITINAPNQLFVRGRGLDTEFAGNVRVTGSTTDVVPIGGFELVRGRLDILGNRLSIEEANITLQGSFVPVLNIVAETESDEYTLNVIISGPAANPDIEFTSDPELPEEEVLARLLFGRGLDTLSPFQAAQLAVAVRTLAGQGGEGIVRSIRGGAGLADLDIGVDEDGNTEIRAGTYLTEDIYTDFSVDSEGETLLNLNFDLTRSLTVKGSTSNDGETSVGIFFQRDY